MKNKKNLMKKKEKFNERKSKKNEKINEKKNSIFNLIKIDEWKNVFVCQNPLVIDHYLM